MQGVSWLAKELLAAQERLLLGVIQMDQCVIFKMFAAFGVPNWKWAPLTTVQE